MPDFDVPDVPVINNSAEAAQSEIDPLKESNQDPKANEETQKEDDDDESKDGWLDVLGSGFLKVKTIVKGEPNTRPQQSDICTVQLEGRLEDGTVVEKFNNLRITVGGRDVIQGLDLVLPLLDVGQRVEVLMKPRFGYGSIGLPPKIPPDATLYYTVELLKTEIPPDVTNIPFDERRTLAALKKDKGNWWYSRGDATNAIQLYRAALDFLQDGIPYVNENTSESTEIPEETFRAFVEDRMKVYNNMAAAQMIISAYDSALVSVDNVLQCEPNNMKALFRKGKILAAKGNTQDAVVVLKKVAQLHPDNAAIRKELNSSLKQLAQDKLKEKALFQKMFKNEKNEDASSGRSSLGSQGKQSSKWTYILGAAATIVASAALAVGLGLHKSITIPYID